MNDVSAAPIGLPRSARKSRPAPDVRQVAAGGLCSTGRPAAARRSSRERPPASWVRSHRRRVARRPRHVAQRERAEVPELFENARREAPCVLFFDEVDAIGRKRTQVRHSGGRDVIVQFLSELDSFGVENEGVFVLAADQPALGPSIRLYGGLDGSIERCSSCPRTARHARGSSRLRLRSVRRRGSTWNGCRGSPPVSTRVPIFAHVCGDRRRSSRSRTRSSRACRGRSEARGPGRRADRRRVKPRSTTAWLQTAAGNFAEFANEGGVYDELLRCLRERSICVNRREARVLLEEPRLPPRRTA